MPRPNALVTLAIGPAGDDLLAVSGPGLRDWAERLNADFYLIRKAPAAFALAGKWHLPPIIARHERTLYVDADALVNLRAGWDVFAEVPEDHLGLYDELPDMRGNSAWWGRLLAMVAESQGWAVPPMPRAWNAGVMVASRRHADLFRPPALRLPVSHVAEQAFNQLVFARAGVPVSPLADRWNLMWWPTQSMPSVAQRPDVVVRHFAGSTLPHLRTDHANRLAMMRKAAGEIFQPDERQP